MRDHNVVLQGFYVFTGCRELPRASWYFWNTECHTPNFARHVVATAHLNSSIIVLEQWDSATAGNRLIKCLVNGRVCFTGPSTDFVRLWSRIDL